MYNRIDTYFSDLNFRFDIIKQHSKETDLYLSTSFNVFDYIYVDENKLSDIIADLLNPEGKHGQCSLFLNEFIKIIKREDLISSALPKVNREIGTTLIPNMQRRMDILIEWESYGIMIENKPWAKDQKDQLWDYKNYLERRFNQNFFIVYLSKRSLKPSENSISKGNLDTLIENNQFVKISFENELKIWIRNCIKECQSEKMRYFLKDLINFLNNNFS